MTSEAQRDEPSPEAQSLARTTLEPGPFVLRTLLADVPLSADGDRDDIKINCVDYLDGNLYVGTSASELLHFFQIPPDPSDKSGDTPPFILASRLRPAFAEPSGGSRPGVQQILLLPQVGKACILCNYTVTFYSLPELSPVLTQVRNCSWIGGIDLNGTADAGSQPSKVTVLLSLNRKIQVVRIGEDARGVKNIDFSGSTISVRRDSIACVADSRTYALLDVDRQLKIPLMSISSLDDSQASGVLGHVQSLQSTADGGLLRSASNAQARAHSPAIEASGHSRSTSLGGFIANRFQDRRPDAEGLAAQAADAPPQSQSPGPEAAQTTPSKPGPADKPLPAAPGIPQSVTEPQISSDRKPKPKPIFLKPHIASPTPEEFFLVTGTGPLEPGIGMFVNLDGDPTRPTIEFDRYPKDIVIDGGSSDLSSSRISLAEEDEGYVLASMTKDFAGEVHHGLEIQRWDASDGQEVTKFWLELPTGVTDDPPNTSPIGIRSLMGKQEVQLQEIVKRLGQKRFSPFSSGVRTPDASATLKGSDSRTAMSMERLSKEKDLFEGDSESSGGEPLPEGWEASRIEEEEDFAARLAKTTARIAMWTGDHIWWGIRNPSILRLEAGLDANSLGEKIAPETAEERRQLFTVLNSFRGQEAKTELEFLTFSYIRQRAGALLFAGFLHAVDKSFPEPEQKALTEVLLDGGLDPRVVLAMIPGLRNEIIQSRRGIWVHGGVKTTVERYTTSDQFYKIGSTLSALEPRVLHFLKRFLTAWRRKKGFGSIPDESEVFRTVDAALLSVLLELDQASPRGPARKGSIREELNEVVDKGVDCFDRAVDLLESYHRLYVLSRLHQSRRSAGDVLATWRRIVEGEQDDGGELQDGEQSVREYLSKISSQPLVQEYGLWLAERNPKLGVQIFADDRARAPKFDPAQVVALLREEAPEAVKYYLEYLVFDKGHTIYVNELITYYLDIVVTDLESSPASRETTAGTYDAYRALSPPKPTYRQFLTDNAPPDDEVWHSRLRLLQLLGGAHDYDVEVIRNRLASAQDLLVPETIILDGRERRHEDALRLLVHRLGDHAAAVSYCLRGGSGGSEDIFTASAARRSSSSAQPATTTPEQQRRLFRALLGEFLALEDVSERLEQTGGLLERFGGWFDALEVLALVPEEWPVEVAAGFLIGALRGLVRERHESGVARALSGAENLKVAHELLVRIEEEGPKVETEGSVTGGGGREVVLGNGD